MVVLYTLALAIVVLGFIGGMQLGGASTIINSILAGIGLLVAATVLDTLKKIEQSSRAQAELLIKLLNRRQSPPKA